MRHNNNDNSAARRLMALQQTASTASQLAVFSPLLSMSLLYVSILAVTVQVYLFTHPASVWMSHL